MTTPSAAAGRAAGAAVPDAPASTYRLQITAGFTLDRAATWVGYLRRLGADWIYTSPLLAATPGSDHGYDVIDHARTDPARGGEAGLATLAAAAHDAGLGVLVDIVPNHVGVAVPLVSVWWRDVLTHGAASRYAAAFDIDWAAGDGKILLPVLGDGGDALDALRVEGGTLRYYEHAFPLAPGTADDGADAGEVHDRQHYRLVGFRRADADLNYRRFFAVSSLAAIRVEDEAVFDASHREIRRWIESGWVDGLRVDHPDGLADPAGYLRDLAALSGGRYTVVEKILEPDEDLPNGWECAGTTGYDALALIDRVLTDPAGEVALTALDARLQAAGSSASAADESTTGAAPAAGSSASAADAYRATWAELTHATKRAAADTILGSEVRRLARVLAAGASRRGTTARDVDAIAEILANFDVYRTYDPARDPELAGAVARARGRRPDLAAELAAIEVAARGPGEFATRLQQTSGSVMAKGVEDCAFYRTARLASLTEVGGDPASFALSPAAFHTTNRRRLATWPHGMTTLSTHDTKRGEDVRARIGALAEIPGDWAGAVTGWINRLGFPDPVLANLVLQTALGAWPVEEARLHAYAEKAAREAGNSTGWIDPDAAFEEALHGLVAACYHDPVIGPELTALADRLRTAGWSNSLAAKLVQLTMPGVPDVYRGTELWSNDLVDPDNRRPFDALAPGGAADLLARLDDGWQPPVDASGAAKLLVVSRALRARRDRPDYFTGYRAVEASGPATEHVLAFDRGGAITVVTRLPVGLAREGGWGDTSITLPEGEFRDVLTDRVAPPRGGAHQRRGAGVIPGIVTAGGGRQVRLADLLGRYPVALLLQEQPAVRTVGA